jgi:hypothetical protein
MAIYLTSSADPIYNNVKDDIRVNVSSKVFTMRDGTVGGIPVSGVNYGLPTVVRAMVEYPSGVEGYSLQRFMNEFPRYSRISNDRSSIGAQLMTPISQLFDELLDERVRTLDSFNLRFYPLVDSSVIHEWDFNETTVLQNTPVSGRIGSTWFNLPIATSPVMFWQSSPTRLETTTAEISGLVLFDWTPITASGYHLLLNTNTTLPVHNKVWVHVSGGSQFYYKVNEDQIAELPYVMIYGYWSQDSLRPGNYRREKILLDSNGEFRTINSYRRLDRVEAMGLSPGASVKMTVFNFNARARVDTLVKHQDPVRDDPFTPVFWHLVSENNTFNEVVQTELPKPVLSGYSYLVKSKTNRDTFYDADIEYDPVDVWALSDVNGAQVSGIIDIRPIPGSRYILALTNRSTCYVYDTFKPAINLVGFSETTAAPARIEARWPASNSNKFKDYTTELSVITVDNGIGIQRWQWGMYYNGQKYNLNQDGTFSAYSTNTNWFTNTSGINQHTINVALSGVGQYTFELFIVDDLGQMYKTYKAVQRVNKRAIAELPIRALSVAPSGIDFDAHSRPWVNIGDYAIRLVTRYDVGYWLTDSRVLITREPYDEVRIV